MELFGENNLWVIVSLFSTAAAALVHLIGFATPYWYSISSEYYNAHFGLWLYCAGGRGETKCASSVATTGAVKGAQALECLAFIAFLMAMASSCGKICIVKLKKLLLLVSAIANFVAAGCSLLGAIVFSGNDYTQGGYHFSFAFVIIASLIAIAAGVFAIIGWKQVPTASTG